MLSRSWLIKKLVVSTKPTSFTIMELIIPPTYLGIYHICSSVKLINVVLVTLHYYLPQIKKRLVLNDKAASDKYIFSIFFVNIGI